MIYTITLWSAASLVMYLTFWEHPEKVRTKTNQFWPLEACMFGGMNQQANHLRNPWTHQTKGWIHQTKGWIPAFSPLQNKGVKKGYMLHYHAFKRIIRHPPLFLKGVVSGRACAWGSSWKWMASFAKWNRRPDWHFPRWQDVPMVQRLHSGGWKRLRNCPKMRNVKPLGGVLEKTNLFFFEKKPIVETFCFLESRFEKGHEVETWNPNVCRSVSLPMQISIVI